MTDMPKEIYLYPNGATIHGEKVIPEFGCLRHSSNGMGKMGIKYIRADDVQPLIEALRELTNGTQHSAAQYERARKALEAFDGKPE